MTRGKWHRVVFVLAGIFISDGLDSISSQKWGIGAAYFILYFIMFLWATNLEEK